MSVVVKAAGIAIVGGAISLVIKRNDPELALLTSLAAALSIIALASGALREIAELIEKLCDRTGVTPAVLSAVLKSGGIAIVTKLAGDMCRDASQSAAASAVELAGAAAALVCALPLIETVISMVDGLL